MMECPRCHGLMVIDTFLNHEGLRNTAWAYEWRCLNCGEIFDTQTLANRNTCQQKGTSPHSQKVA